MDWELEIITCKLLHIKQINNKILLYITGNQIQYPEINYIGKEQEKAYVFICIAESLCYTPETHIVSQLYFNKKKILVAVSQSSVDRGMNGMQFESLKSISAGGQTSQCSAFLFQLSHCKQTSVLHSIQCYSSHIFTLFMADFTIFKFLLKYV